MKVWVKSSTDQLHNLAVQGPLARDILKGLVATPPHLSSLEELKWFRFTIGRVARCRWWFPAPAIQASWAMRSGAIPRTDPPSGMPSGRRAHRRVCSPWDFKHWTWYGSRRPGVLRLRVLRSDRSLRSRIGFAVAAAKPIMWEAEALARRGRPRSASWSGFSPTPPNPRRTAISCMRGGPRSASSPAPSARPSSARRSRCEGGRDARRTRIAYRDR